MKTRIYQVVIVLISLFSSVNVFGQTSLEVIVKNIKGTKGTILIGLFIKEDDFLKTPYQVKTIKPLGSEMKVVFEDLPTGSYAISVIHDENENKKLDTRSTGIPKEGFGFGNNASKLFGPASFDDAKVKVADKPVQQIILLKYL